MTGWKEIAAHLDQGVRTIQRWEQQAKLPVHRINVQSERSPVFAFQDELDAWLEHTEIKSRPYVRPVLIVLDPPEATAISHRKLALETLKYNVLTAFTSAELLATLARFDLDGAIVDCDHVTAEGSPLCSELRRRHPKLKILVIIDRDDQLDPDKLHFDYTVIDGDVQSLVRTAEEAFGVPRLT